MPSSSSAFPQPDSTRPWPWILSTTGPSATSSYINSLFQSLTLSRAEWAMIVLPVIAYWIFSTFFYVLSLLNLTTLEMHKIPTDQKARPKNRVTVRQVLRAVAVQHGVQAVVAWLLAVLTRPAEGVGEWSEMWVFPVTVGGLVEGRSYPVRFGGVEAAGVEAWIRLWDNGWRGWVKNESWAEVMMGWEGLIVVAVKLGLAMFILDSYQYWIHRLFHTNRYLYRKIHATHHALTHPFAFGALYNHPIEGFLFDTIGGGLPALLLDMHPWTATAFFTFSTLKTVDDHCGYAVPWDPFQKLFRNNAEYHDIHHWGKGIRYNFSQPFFIHWDIWMGTDYHQAMAKLARAKGNEESSVSQEGSDGQVRVQNLKSKDGSKAKKEQEIRLRRAISALELTN
ncbi:hypothetical protein HK097_004725 [Rhizophlyctis rosea]|uniref:Fatty acid hydroxylase domain-containing protein n=1 Tax=Rhizophlyctis rosea TaxID=64517 RepID=A0AAD5SLT9_9FUNG|nr:hypothetical protein HK097_004725 [Rhizophlyctis rosea]